jgi:ATP adenylyltransferase
MTFTQLKQYLQQTMRMSHVYQPVMIRRLLLNGGVADTQAIAKDLVQHDESQIEYYMLRVDQMVGVVLRKNKVVTKDKKSYHLPDFESYTPEEQAEIIAICEQRIEEYMTKRGMDIWDHRRRNRKPIDGSIRYQVLERAHNRCELCGVSSEIRALEVDHIVPKNWGGEDVLHNYQALCYQCNANKRDTDDTDFRNRPALFEKREEYCLFCGIDRGVIMENNLAIAFYDKYPVTEGHTLIIPKRHFESYFDITQAELNAIQQLIQQQRSALLEKDSSITGFNIGINQGEDAGQSIFHLHVHLIPRRKGDMENPKGGVRHVIPDKGKY